MTTTKLHFFNSTNQETSNQILLFLQPVGPKEDYAFSAWNVLNPSIGSAQTATLDTTFAASIAELSDQRGDYSAPVELSLGEARSVINPNDQSPRIGGPAGQLMSEQVGLENDTLPSIPLSVTWYVSGKRVVETNNTPTTTLNSGFTATFELKQSVYCMLAQRPQETKTYKLQAFSHVTEFRIPNGEPELWFEVYTGADGKDGFKQISKEEFDKLMGGARRHHLEMRRMIAHLRR